MVATQRVKSLIEANEKHQILSDWDSRFLQSVYEQLQKNRTLSVRQNDILQKIESKLSADAIKEIAEWESAWGVEHRRKAIICAKYYKRIGTYFRDIAARVLEEPEWVMPKNTYQKMCENKYAKKVLSVVESTPAHSCGSIVMLRTTAQKSLGWVAYTEMKEKPLFVMEILDDVHSAAKGAKRYKVLPAGAIKTVEVEERQIKKYKKAKTTKKTTPYNDVPF